MAITPGKPRRICGIDAYRRVSVATGSGLIHVAGRVAWDCRVMIGSRSARAFPRRSQVEAVLPQLSAWRGSVARPGDVAEADRSRLVDWTPTRCPWLGGPPGAAAGWGPLRSRLRALLGRRAALDVPEHLVLGSRPRGPQPQAWRPRGGPHPRGATARRRVGGRPLVPEVSRRRPGFLPI